MARDRLVRAEVPTDERHDHRQLMRRRVEHPVTLWCMAYEGQELVGPNGFRLKLVRISDEVLEMEGSYSGEGGLPPEHFHPRQDEHFEVLEGAVRAVIHGEEHRFVADEAFDIAAGTPHRMAGDGHARLHWEVRPALRMAEFFETAYSGDPGQDFLQQFADEFRLTRRAAPAQKST